MFGSSFCVIMENINGVFSARCNVILLKAWQLSLMKQLLINSYITSKLTSLLTILKCKLDGNIQLHQGSSTLIWWSYQVDGLIRWAKSSSQLVNLSRAQPLKCPYGQKVFLRFGISITSKNVFNSNVNSNGSCHKIKL